MYRHMSLRLPCERCAVVQVTRAMMLSPSGAGYLCWKCEVSAQIAEHESAFQTRRRQNALPSLGVALFVLAVFSGLVLLGLWQLVAAIGHIG
jgi:hypothetical protein